MIGCNHVRACFSTRDPNQNKELECTYKAMQSISGESGMTTLKFIGNGGIINMIIPFNDVHMIDSHTYIVKNDDNKWIVILQFFNI